MKNQKINILKNGVSGLETYLFTIIDSLWEINNNSWNFIMTVTKGYIDAFKKEGLLSTEIEEIMGECFDLICEISVAQNLDIDEHIQDYISEVQ